MLQFLARKAAIDRDLARSRKKNNRMAICKSNSPFEAPVGPPPTLGSSRGAAPVLLDSCPPGPLRVENACHAISLTPAVQTTRSQTYIYSATQVMQTLSFCFPDSLYSQRCDGLQSVSCMFCNVLQLDSGRDYWGWVLNTYGTRKYTNPSLSPLQGLVQPPDHCMTSTPLCVLACRHRWDEPYMLEPNVKNCVNSP